uniref:Leucine-rich repeat-containing protein 16A-like n=1 Tax=Phallusia mammillata TaxID=59560 RepID=A0A6F9DKM3_9ASCI|nr:leucine-rich repeat-containing protein 16A-like [Phallusia mammillata]
MSNGVKTFSGEYGTIDVDLDELPSPRNSNRYSQGNGSTKEGLSLSGTLKRGIKLAATDQVETTSLSGTLRRGIKIHSLGKGESIQNLSVYDPSPSPRNSKKFSFKSPKRSKKTSDDTVSMNRMPKNGNLRLNEVIPNPSPFDDTISMIGGLLEGSASIKQEEGIRDVIGRKKVVTLKKMVKLERPQGDKVDAKVLVLTPYRCQILGVKAPFKMEADFHFLEIKSMDSPSPDRLVMSTHSSKIFFMQMIGTDDADHIIGRVALSLRTIFPSVPLSRILKASLEPLHRQKVIQQMLNQADQSEPGPCGNFSEMYRCVCDFLSCPVREEVEWDVDTIYLSQNCRELSLKDFDLPDARDIIPIVSVLNYNKWFEGLIVRNTKLHGEILDFVLKAARNSQNMKTLVLEGVGLKGEFAQKLATNMVENKESRIETLDLSNNPLEDKGLIHLSGALPVIKHASLTDLNVARTGLTAKGVNGLCQALRSSANIMGSLTHLNLSGNCLKVDDSEGLYNFLATENHLLELDLSATDSSVEMYISALSHGCLMHLQHVNLSKNHFLGKKQKDTSLPSSFQEFFQNTHALKSIDFSGIKFPNEGLKCIMDGLLVNLTKGLEVSVNLSSCEIKQSGCQVIQSGIGTVRNLVGLDLSDNSMDNELPNFFGWLQQNKSLRELKIGRNFSGIKQKNIRPVMDSIVELVQEENSVLESLSLADSKLREYTHVLLGCLGSNTSLTELDISGNQMGDTGARVLAKSVQINSKLKILKFDRNNLSAAGFHELAVAMGKNYTLRYMPYPVNDCMGAMKQHPERTQTALAQIQDLLLRNANTNRASNDQQFRLQKVVTSTAQQVLDKVAEKVDDVINALEIIDAESENASCVIVGKKLVRDAKNSKELLSDIYGLGMEKSAGPSSQLQCKISEMATNVDKMVQEHIKSTVDAMTKNAESQCPQIYEEIKSDLTESVAARQVLPAYSVRDHVIQSSGTEIVNQVSELNLSIATLISDKVTDSLLAALSQCNLQLTSQLSKYKEQQTFGAQSQRQQRYDEEAPAEVGSPSPDAVAVTGVDGKPPSGDLLPDMRRERAQSVAKRRQRPVNTSSYEENGNKGHQLGDLPPIPGSKPKTPAEEDEAKKITDFGPDVYDPYSNDKVKERKMQKRLEEEKTSKQEQEEKTEVAPEAEKTPKKKEEKKKKEKKKEPGKKKKSNEEVESKQVDEVVAEQKDTKQEEKVEEPKTEDKTSVEAAEDQKSDEKDTTDGVEVTPPAPSPAVEIDLPDTDSHPKLDHVTKTRARAPNRRTRRPPTKKPEVEQEKVDDFFTSDVSNTDFSVTPTRTEEEKLKEKDKQEEKKAKMLSGGILMGGMPMVTPGMLKKKPVSPQPSSEPPPAEESNEEADPSSPSAVPDDQKPTPATRRPKGAMVMPGMGFGNNLFAEMKQRKLNKKAESDDPKSPAKDSTNGGEASIGPELLRKTSPRHSPNVNNNNSKVPPSDEKVSPLKKWGISLHHKDHKGSEKPEPEKKVALKPPIGGKGKPPPLPTKPKPSFLKSGLLKEGKSRPMSEFIDSSSHSDSIVRNRAASWGKLKVTKETKDEN